MKCKPLRVATVLFILTALSANVVGVAFAKYAVSDSSVDYAHVAKWGITVFSRGNLYGTVYDGAPSNTVTSSSSGSVTVRSYNATALDGNVVAPGTKNTVGLEFGMSGVAETALKIDVTIKNQNIALHNDEYFILHKIPEPVTSENFTDVQGYYGAIYVADSESYRKLDAYADATTYYTVNTRVDFTDKTAWAYCPVVYEIEPTDGTHGFKATHLGIKEYTGSDLAIGINGKSLDIISYFLQEYSLNDVGSWPNLSEKNVYERTVSKVFPAGTDLGKISAFYSNGVNVSMSSEKLTWSWNYQQSTNPSLYNSADNILGRLSAEKIYGPLDDDIVVIRNREYTFDEGQLVITPALNDTVLIRPTEYVDYCLDTSFEIQMTVTQVN